MADQQKIKDAVQGVIRSLMDGVMERVLIEDPFVADEHKAKKPLYAALVPDEIFKGSHFERRFVTPFGKVWEKLARAVAERTHGIGEMDHGVRGLVKQERLRRIEETLRRLEHPPEGQRRVKPNWDVELTYIMDGQGEDIPVTVVCDVYAENRSSELKMAFEIKAPLPNSDQTKVSKEKLLKLYCMEPRIISEAYFALPYNPYGKREDYKWSFPARWFDMKKDKVVLIGDEFWDKLGGTSTYRSFITAINEIGGSYRERIYREFLGIEPPLDRIENPL